MFKRALRDGNVWLVAGMACFALSFALEHWAGTSPTVDFIRVFLIGLVIVAFGATTAMLIAHYSQAPQKPVGRPALTKRGRCWGQSNLGECHNGFYVGCDCPLESCRVGDGERAGRSHPRRS